MIPIPPPGAVRTSSTCTQKARALRWTARNTTHGESLPIRNAAREVSAWLYSHRADDRDLDHPDPDRDDGSVLVRPRQIGAGPIEPALSCLNVAAQPTFVERAEVLRDNAREIPANQFLGLVAKNSKDTGVGIDHGALFVDGEHCVQRSFGGDSQAVAFVNHIADAVVLKKKPNLGAKRAQKLFHLRIGKVCLRAEKFEDSEHSAGLKRRKSDTGVQTFQCGHGSSREVRFFGDVGEPDCLAGFPAGTGQSISVTEATNPSDQFKARILMALGGPESRAP